MAPPKKHDEDDEDEEETAAAAAAAFPALHMACYKKHVDFIRLLLSWGADLGVQDVNGQTPRAIAEKKGWTEVVEVLEAHKASTGKGGGGGK